MKKSNIQLKDIFKEFTSKGYFERSFKRAQRRKSPWNLILIPLGILGVGLSYFVQFRLLWFIHVFIYPSHYGLFKEILGRKGPANFPQLLFTLPIFFSSLVLGMMIANMLAWCIPPARQTFEKESQGLSWVSFNDSMRALTIIAIYVVPICLFLGFIGALTLK